MAGLTDLTLAEGRAGLANGDFSSEELTRAHLDALEASRSLNAFVTETPERALDMARASDARRARGQAGLLEGLPIAVKDLFCTEGVQTTAGSRILGGFTPPYESTVTANLWAEGAVMLGKTNMDEFAMGSSNITSHYGRVENPWRAAGSPTGHWRRAAPPAARRRPWRRAPPRRRPAPIPAARSASRRRSAASSA